MSKLNIVVLGSTRGTNLQAIIDAIKSNELAAIISLVISDKENSYILQRASNNNIANKFISAKNKSRDEYGSILINEIKACNPDLILLIGFMRILSIKFTNEFSGKILNVHPSLLPKYSGLMNLAVYKAVLDAKDSQTGCTIHHVNEEVDGGEILLQLKCSVDQKDTIESLKYKVQALESKAWIEVIKSWKVN